MLRRAARSAFTWLLSLCFAAALGAAPVELSEGLWYARSADIADLPADADAVIDLRYALAPEEAPAWLNTASSRAQVVLLAGATASTWGADLESRPARMLLMSPADQADGADLQVSVSAAANEAAVAAINDGYDVSLLALPVVAKRRFDESALVRHHNGDDAESTEPAPTEDTTVEVAEPETPAAAPTDPMLERAVQVLQGLAALQRR